LRNGYDSFHNQVAKSESKLKLKMNENLLIGEIDFFEFSFRIFISQTISKLEIMYKILQKRYFQAVEKQNS
jgi:hypothetical protein